MMGISRAEGRALDEKAKAEVCGDCGSRLLVAVNSTDLAFPTYALRCPKCNVYDPPTTIPGKTGPLARFRRERSIAHIDPMDVQTIERQLRKTADWDEAAGKPPGVAADLLALLREQLQMVQDSHSNRALTVTTPQQQQRAVAVDWATDDNRQLLKDQLVGAGITDAQFSLFWATALSRKLNPLARQIYAIPRNVWNSDTQRKEPRMVMITGVDGFRLIAQRSAEYAGSDDPEFGPMVDDPFIQLPNKRRPEWCRVTVYRLVKGHRVPFTATVYWEERTQYTYGKGSVITGYSGVWGTQPRGQIAIRAEVAALRKGFAEEMGSIELEGDVPSEEPQEMVSYGATVRTVDLNTGEIMDDAAPLPGDEDMPVVEGEIMDPTAADSQRLAALANLLDAAQGYGVTEEELNRRAKARFGKDTVDDLTADELRTALAGLRVAEEQRAQQPMQERAARR